MLFNSINFLIFFPIVVLIYFVLPHKTRWVWLLVSSYYFYMSWNPKYVLLLTASIVITFFTGLMIDKTNKLSDERKKTFLRKLWVFLSFFLNLAILFFFKYFNFVFDSMSRAFSHIGIQLVDPQFDILLPIGISFYTFQALSYTMDLYRGEIKAEKNIAKYAVFVSFFPQLMAGPIERSKNLLHQFSEKHTFDYTRVKSGVLLMLWGFFLKVVIADRMAFIVNTVYDNYQSYFGFQIIIATLFFAIQIYCDFAGYTYIAKGAGQVLGFRLMDNFQQPYFSSSLQDFWRRWHISLSTWFRDYLYIPLGGSRCSKKRKNINIMIVFLISGLWHGANWNYVLWGGIHGVYQVIANLLKPYKEKLSTIFHIKTDAFSFKLIKIIVTFLLVNFAWIFFRAPSATAAFVIIKNMFSEFNPWIFFDGSIYDLGLMQIEFYIALIAILILFIVDLIKYCKPKFELRKWLFEQNLFFRWIVYFAGIFSLLIFGVYGPGYDASQFIYFQF